MEWRPDKPVPFDDENEYRQFMERLLKLAIDDGYNPEFAKLFFELQRRAWLYNHFNREIDSSKEERLFNLGIYNNIHSEPTLGEENEIEP